MSFTINSGTVIFDVIKVLQSAPKSREEFCQKLKERNLSTDNDTITKYVRTLRELDFDVVYRNGAFQLIKTPFKYKIENEEIEGLEIAISLLRELFKGKIEPREKDFEEKMLNLFDFDKNLIKTKEANTLKFKKTKTASYNIFKLNQYILNPAILKIQYFKKEFLILPKELKYQKNGVFLIAYNKTEEKIQKFKVNLIVNLKFQGYLNDEFEFLKQETVFKISGRLIKNYILREGEIAHYKEDCVLVTNFVEEKEELFSRLLKYGKYCEVVYPEKDRQIFIQKLKDLIEHYEKMEDYSSI